MLKNEYSVFNTHMTAKKFISKEKPISLLYIYDTAPTPILVHCSSVRDRTGEAAAIWVLEMIGLKKDKALEQLVFIPFFHIQSLHPAKAFLISQEGKRLAYQ